MAFSLQITAARQTYASIAPGGEGWTLSIGYCLCVAGAGGTLRDVVLDRQDQMLHTTLQAGHAMPVPQEVAALIRQDCQALYGGQPDHVLVAGQSL